MSEENKKALWAVLVLFLGLVAVDKLILNPPKALKYKGRRY